MNGTQYMGLAHAPSPLGPWTRPNRTILPPSPSGFEANFVCNPALLQLPSGGLALVYRGGSDWGYGVCTTPSWDGDCVRTPVNAFGNDTRWLGTEDPFAFESPRGGGYILLSHRSWGFESFADTFKGGGTKAISRDGLAWAWAGDYAFTYDVALTNGTTRHFQRREEPKLLLNDQGHPTHLFTVISEQWGGGEARIIVQALDYS